MSINTKFKSLFSSPFPKLPTVGQWDMLRRTPSDTHNTENGHQVRIRLLHSARHTTIRARSSGIENLLPWQHYLESLIQLERIREFRYHRRRATLRTSPVPEVVGIEASETHTNSDIQEIGISMRGERNEHPAVEELRIDSEIIEVTSDHFGSIQPISPTSTISELDLAEQSVVPEAPTRAVRNATANLELLVMNILRDAPSVNPPPNVVESSSSLQSEEESPGVLALATAMRDSVLDAAAAHNADPANPRRRPLRDLVIPPSLTPPPPNRTDTASVHFNAATAGSTNAGEGSSSDLSDDGQFDFTSARREDLMRVMAADMAQYSAARERAFEMENGYSFYSPVESSGDLEGGLTGNESENQYSPGSPQTFLEDPDPPSEAIFLVETFIGLYPPTCSRSSVEETVEGFSRWATEHSLEIGVGNRRMRANRGERIHIYINEVRVCANTVQICANILLALETSDMLIFELAVQDGLDTGEAIFLASLYLAYMGRIRSAWRSPRFSQTVLWNILESGWGNWHKSSRLVARIENIMLEGLLLNERTDTVNSLYESILEPASAEFPHGYDRMVLRNDDNRGRIIISFYVRGRRTASRERNALLYAHGRGVPASRLARINHNWETLLANNSIERTRQPSEQSMPMDELRYHRLEAALQIELSRVTIENRNN